MGWHDMYRYFLLLYLPLAQSCFPKHCTLVLRFFVRVLLHTFLCPILIKTLKPSAGIHVRKAARAKPSLASMCTHGCLGPLDGGNLYAKQLSEVSLYQCLGE